MEVQAMSSDPSLDIPAFLRASARPKTKVVFRRKKMKPKRPEGEKWAEAERWQIIVPSVWSDKGKEKSAFGSGYRGVWVIIGTKWVELRDAEDLIRVPRAEWERIAKKGRKLY